MEPQQLSIIAGCETEEVTEKILSISTNEALLEQNRTYFENYCADIIAAFDMPYVEGYGKFMDLAEKIEKGFESNPDAFLTAVLQPAVGKIFSLSVHSKTYNNAIRAAIELYLAKAKTGKLPDELPTGLPKDLLSGKDFEYEKTADGFILRCQGEELGKGKIHEYKFGVKK